VTDAIDPTDATDAKDAKDAKDPTDAKDAKDPTDAKDATYATDKHKKVDKLYNIMYTLTVIENFILPLGFDLRCGAANGSPCY
jgi:hypothetical protein